MKRYKKLKFRVAIVRRERRT